MYGDPPGAIEALDDIRGGLGVPPPGGARLELQNLVEDPDGIVGGHLPLVVEGADPVEIQAPGQRPVPAGGDGRRHGELAIEGREEGRGEEGVACRQGRDAGQPHLGHQPVLERSPQPVDAALGLRAGGRDVVDPQCLEGAADLGGRLGARQLLGDGPMLVGAQEDAGGVGVDGGRPACGSGDRAEEREVPRGILLRPEEGRQEAASRPPVAAPGEGAPIEREGEARLGLAGAPASVPGARRRGGAAGGGGG